MRLISLILALVGLIGIIIYAKDSMTTPQVQSDQTVKQHTKQVIDEAQRAADQLQKQLEEQQKKMDELNQ